MMQLQEENSRLKPLVAGLSLDKPMLQGVLRSGITPRSLPKAILNPYLL
jgi:hypothetical protein